MLKRVILDINKLNMGDNAEYFVDNTEYFVIHGIWTFLNSAPLDRNRKQIDEDFINSSFLITDNREAADLALELGLGFSAYTNSENTGESFSESLYCIDSIQEMSDANLNRMYERANGLPWHILDTRRLTVREITIEDVDRLYEIYSDEDVKRYIEDLYEDRDEEIKYTKDYINNQYRFYEYGMWVVINRETGELIGRAGIFDRAEQDLAELGFMFGKEYWNKGFAYETLVAILEYAKEELGIEKLYAHTIAENERSKKLLKKLGFVFSCKITIDGKEFDRYSFDYKQKDRVIIKSNHFDNLSFGDLK